MKRCIPQSHCNVCRDYQSQSGEVSSRKKSVDVCYSLLDVDPDCSEDELRTAYLEKVLHCQLRFKAVSSIVQIL